MKKIKFYLLFTLVVTLFSSCEKEPLEIQSSEESGFKYLNPISKSDISSYSLQKNSASTAVYRILESHEEFKSLCTSTRQVWKDVIYEGFYIGLTGSSTFSNFGATFKGFSGNALGIKIVVLDHETDTYIYEKTFSNTDNFYWGISTNKLLSVIVRSLDNNHIYVVESFLGECTYVPEELNLDADEDGINDDQDNCPTVANPNQEDNDLDGVGDICDLDDDNDGINDDIDNCPLFANPGQEDFDLDGIGDDCDPDIDNDGVLNVEDLTPFSNMENTIKIGDCDTGVINGILENGITMSDLVDELEKGVYKNLGQEIKTYTDLANYWIEKGVLSGDQKIQLLNCVR